MIADLIVQYTHSDKERTAEQAIPRVFGIIREAVVQEYRPFVARSCDFSWPELLLNPNIGQPLIWYP